MLLALADLLAAPKHTNALVSRYLLSVLAVPASRSTGCRRTMRIS